MQHPGPIRVLLVEDDPEDAFLTRKRLAEIEHEEYLLDHVDSYDHALAALQANQHEVCLLDYRLGSQTGIDLLREARAAGCQVPTLMLTGEKGREVDLEASGAGARDYLVKDELTPALLERAVRYALQIHQRERLLEETQDRLRLVIEQLPGGVWTTDHDLRYTWTVGPFSVTEGHTAEAMVGRSLADMLQLDDPEAPPLAAHRQALAGQPARYESILAGRPVEVQVRPLCAPDGTLMGTVGMALDISERQAAEEALRQSEARFQAFMDHSPLLAWIKDGEGRYLYGNNRWQRALGCTLEEALGKTDLDLHAPERAREYRETDLGVLADGMPRVRDEVDTAPDGTREHSLVFKFRLLDREGRPMVGGLGLDVSRQKEAEERLQQHLSILHGVIEGTTDAIYVKDPAGHYLLINSAGAAFLGSPMEEIIGRPDAEFFSTDTLDRVLEGDRRALAGETHTREDTVTAAGVTRTYQAVKAPLRDAAGQVIGVVGVSRDITEQKQAEAELARSQRRYESLVRSTAQMVWRTSVDGQIVLGNHSGWEEFTGQSRAEREHDGWLNAVHPEDLPRVAALWNEILANPESAEAEFRVRAASGEYRYLLARGVPVRDDAGTMVEWIGTCTDVTEQRCAETALRESEARFRTIAEAAPLGVCLADAAGRTLYINPAWAQQVGLPAAEVMAGGWINTVHPEDRERVVRTWQHARERGESYISERRWVHPDGKVVHTRAHIAAVRLQGEMRGFVGVSEDISERLALEQQVAQSQKMEAIGNLAGGIAHDFNNMLAVINGYSELVLETLSPDSAVRSYLAEITRAGGRAAALTRQLLAFSRKQLLEPKVLDLNEAVRSVDKLLRRLIGEDVELVTLLDARLGYVKADPSQLEQVLMNLAVNARDAMPQGGRLLLRTRDVDAADLQVEGEVQPGAYVALEVEDSGCGIKPHVRERIFEPFFTTKEQGKGTGLGLATVFGIVKQSGGYINVTSEPGVGTRFTVYLPQIEAAPLPADQSALPPLPSGDETILLVEDEPMVRQMVREVLTQCGYTVLEAIQGDDALRVVAGHTGPIHLMLTDVVMPKMSGRELAERLKAIRPEVQVLFMSGYTDDAVMRHGLAQAEVELLQKPFTHLVLAQRVRRLLDRVQPRTALGHVLVVDDENAQRETLAELLREAGYQVTTAAEGQRAFELLQSGVEADLILLDLMMPGMNGWVFRLEQQKDPALADIPVVIMSGQQDPASVAEFLKPAASLRKPFDPEQLLAVCRSLCSARTRDAV